MTEPNSLEKWTRVVPSAVWNLGLAGAFLVTWLAPGTFGERTVHKLTFVMALEFLVVHSAGFFAAIGGPTTTRWMDRHVADPERAEILTRAAMYGGLMLFYCLFAGMFSLMYGGWWPFLAFLIIAVPKIVSGTFQPSDDQGQFTAILGWAGMTALYIAGAMITTIVPMPSFGVSESVIAAQGYEIEGLWVEEPYRALAFGAFYFTGLAAWTAILDLRILKLPGGR